MATARRTVQVELDERLVSRARKHAAPPSPMTRSSRTPLAGYLLERLIDKTQRRADLREEQAMRLAVAELHALRRERDAAA